MPEIALSTQDESLLMHDTRVAPNTADVPRHTPYPYYQVPQTTRGTAMVGQRVPLRNCIGATSLPTHNSKSHHGVYCCRGNWSHGLARKRYSQDLRGNTCNLVVNNLHALGSMLWLEDNIVAAIVLTYVFLLYVLPVFGPAYPPR